MPSARRGLKTARPYRLVAELLAGKELDRRAVAKLFGVEVAAADRHIDAIADAVPGVIKEKRAHRTTIRLNLDGVRRSSRNEAVAACLGASLAHLFRGSSYEPLLAAVFEQTISRTRKPAEFREARRKFVFVSQGGEIALPDRQGVLDDLIDAVVKQQRAALAYEDFAGTLTKVEIEPWSIAIYDHQLYVLARGENQFPRAYRLSRIREATLRSQRFEYPDRATYDPEVVFRDTFGIFVRGEDPVEDVVLRLAPRWRTYARTHRWHESQSVEDDETGVVVRMRVRACRELEAFILGFGEEAEVVSPWALRGRIAERARRLASQYAHSRGAPAPAPARRARRRRS